MKNKKLQAKVFITIGIFTALLFVVEFACGMLGLIHPYIDLDGRSTKGIWRPILI